jgi:hypothetical protein
LAGDRLIHEEVGPTSRERREPGGREADDELGERHRGSGHLETARIEGLGEQCAVAPEEQVTARVFHPGVHAWEFGRVGGVQGADKRLRGVPTPGHYR